MLLFKSCSENEIEMEISLRCSSFVYTVVYKHMFGICDTSRTQSDKKS